MKKTKREFLRAGAASLVTATTLSCLPQPKGADAGLEIDAGSDAGTRDAAILQDASLARDVLDACRVFPSFAEGPFYINTGLIREDVSEGIVGARTEVRLELIDASTCAPLPDLLIDIWSASPLGDYSGVDNALLVEGAPNTEGETFMRGQQTSDAEGRVVFQTLYPGWYPITPPHFHFTAPIGEQSSFTWQFFLDDVFSDQVYRGVDPYRARGVHVVRTAEQNVPDALVVTPTGPVDNIIVEQRVAIDLSRLGPRAQEYRSR